MTLTYKLDEINSVAQKLLDVVNSKIWLFDAPMGTGKTTLISAICTMLGVTDISSPTFSLVNDYSFKKYKIAHFDLYRLNSTEELLDIGFEDYIDIFDFIFIEWPELAKPLLDKSICTLIRIFQVDINTRKIEVL